LSDRFGKEFRSFWKLKRNFEMPAGEDR
jgi:hypothetical protein